MDPRSLIRYETQTLHYKSLNLHGITDILSNSEDTSLRNKHGALFYGVVSILPLSCQSLERQRGIIPRYLKDIIETTLCDLARYLR